jgi:hypothetical protein
MPFFALIHLFLLACLPVGITMIVMRRWHLLGLPVAIPMLLAGIGAFLFLFLASPLDFLGVGRGFRITTDAGEHQISFVQRPGADFYDSFFEVIRADGRSAKLWIDADDSKCWFPRLQARGSRVYVTSPISDATIQRAFVDAAAGTLTTGAGTTTMASLFE